MAKDFRELLGWYQDWPDGSAQYKVWFDANDQRRESSDPSDNDLFIYLVDNGVVLDVRYDVERREWVGLFMDVAGKPHRDSSFRLRHILIRALRNSHPDGDA